MIGTSGPWTCFHLASLDIENHAWSAYEGQCAWEETEPTQTTCSQCCVEEGYQIQKKSPRHKRSDWRLEIVRVLSRTQDADRTCTPDEIDHVQRKTKNMAKKEYSNVVSVWDAGNLREMSKTHLTMFDSRTTTQNQKSQ